MQLIHSTYKSLQCFSMKIILSGLYGTKPLEFTYRPFKLIELFRIAKELNFDGVDYIATIPDIFTTPKKPLALSKEYGIPIISIHSSMHLLFYTPSFFFNRLISMISLFPDCKVFNFHLSGFVNHFQKNGRNLKQFFYLAKQKGVTLSIESNPLLKGLQYYPKVTYDPELFAQYCIANNLPITFDTAHVAHCNYDIVAFFRKYNKHIKLIHLSDSIGSIQHLSLGKGNLPIKDLLKEIKKSSFNQFIVFEIHNFPKGITIKEKTEEIRNSLNMVKQYAI